eukprot:6542_1
MSTVTLKSDELIVEGELRLYLNNLQDISQWIVLKGNHLHCYENKGKNHQPLHTINLKVFNQIETTSNNNFIIKSKNKSFEWRFTASSTADMNNWTTKIRRATPDRYGTTIKNENKIEFYCSIWLLLLFLSIILLLVIGAALNNHLIYFYYPCMPLSLYEFTIILLCAYFCKKFKMKDIKSLIKFNMFWIQSVFCFIFNILSFLLINIHLYTTKINHNNKGYIIVRSVSYLFGAFSISLPALCIALYYKYKKNERNKYTNNEQTKTVNLCEEKQQDNLNNVSHENVETWLTHTVELPQYYGTFIENCIDDIDSIKLLEDKDLNDMGIKIGHKRKILSYIKKMNQHHPSKLINNQSSSSYIPASKPIFRESVLKGIICFCYFSHYELADKTVTFSNYRVIGHIMKDGVNMKWILIYTLFFVSLVLEVISKVFQLPKYIDLCMNVVWILINLRGVWIACEFLLLFSSIYTKTKDIYKEDNDSESPKSPIIAFVLVSLVLLCFYMVYMLFLVIYVISADNSIKIIWDVCRQSTTWLLLLFQFITLVKVKQIQKFGQTYLDRFDKTEKRAKLILDNYYRFMSILLMYNVIYIFLFKIKYFGMLLSTRNQFVRISYSFSFSLSTSMMLMLNQFINSYQQWRDDQKHQKSLLINLS